ncbi:MAG: twin-arginine translocation signal domain-containing protein [Verrucomicrobiota bacterium]
MQNRRSFLKTSAVAGAGLLLPLPGVLRRSVAAIPGGSLRPTSIPKYINALDILPAMPKAGQIMEHGALVDYYEIALRQFNQNILPPSMGIEPTTVWGYGAVNTPSSFGYPASTIEATVDRPVRVKWINGLIDNQGRYRKHLLTVDQTLHWANPPGGMNGRDGRGSSQLRYTGPVPMVPHLHGAHVQDHSDGYPEAWFLPAAANIPGGYARNGTWYEYFKNKFQQQHGVTWQPGTATYQYTNDQRATTLWFHDHALGMTRASVYSGATGFYLLRGGPADAVTGRLPGPAPAAGDPAGKAYYEIPLVIQDRSFNEDGSLFYPDNRAFFEGLREEQLRISFIPDQACGGQSDVPPLWNAEFFGNCMVVNGHTWPFLNVEQRRYRFRILNACNSRFLILKMSNDMPICQIGADGGFLPTPVSLTQLLVAPAERVDVIIDFTQVRRDTQLLLLNVGPDEPFGGGVPGMDFASADPRTTGQVMMFRVRSARDVDVSTPCMDLVLPNRTPYGPQIATRQVSLNELESATVRVITDPRADHSGVF